MYKVTFEQFGVKCNCSFESEKEASLFINKLVTWNYAMEDYRFLNIESWKE